MKYAIFSVIIAVTALFAEDYTILYGVVVDREDNIVGDAEVQLLRRQGDVERIVASTMSRGRRSVFYDGLFFFKDIQAGAYILRVSKEGYADFEVGIELRKGEIQFRRIILRKIRIEYGAIYGRIILKKSIPIAGLTVELYKGKEPVMTVKTDEKGAYSFKDIVTPAKYRLVVLYRHKELLSEEIELRKKQRLRKVIELPDKAVDLFFGIIEGYVEDEKGKPIRGAKIVMKDAPEGQKKRAETTDESGHFKFELLKPGSYRLEASAPNREKAEEKVSIRAGRKRRVKFRLPKKKRR